MDNSQKRAAERAANKLLKAAGYSTKGTSLRQEMKKRREKADAADVVALREETLSAQRVERERLNVALISADAGLRKLAHTLDET